MMTDNDPNLFRPDDAAREAARQAAAEGEAAALTAAEREEAAHALHFLGHQAQVAQAEGHAALLHQQAQAWDRASAALSTLTLVVVAHGVKRLLRRSR